MKDEQADAVKKRIRQWESENRVLGHHARSDVHRPRALLVLSGESAVLGHSILEHWHMVHDGRDGSCLVHHLVFA